MKHFPVLMSSVRSSVSIFLALVQPGVVPIASVSLLFLLFQAAFHCSGVCGFLRDFCMVFPVFMPSAERIKRYFCWYFIAALVQSNQVWGSVLLIMEAYSPWVEATAESVEYHFVLKAVPS